MDEKRKKSRWEKSLDEAGLLDEEAENSWTLPDGPVDGSVITVPPDSTEETASQGGGSEGSGDDADGFDPENMAEPEGESDEPPLPSLPGAGVFKLSTPADLVKSATRPNPDPWSPEALSAAMAEDEDLPKTPAVNVRGIRVSSGPRSHDEAAQAPAGSIVDGPAEPRRGPGGQVVPDGESQDRSGSLRRSISKAEIPGFRLEMSERFEVGDFSGSLDMAEKILAHDLVDPEALSFEEKCKKTLLEMYESRIGALDQTPTRAIEEQEVVWRDLDPTASFVLSRIDGQMTYSDILDISGLSRFETCRILDQLIQDGIIKS